MPIVVDGWVEVLGGGQDPRDAERCWDALLSLRPFSVGAYEMSGYLFGLTKEPSVTGRFLERGVPRDACAAIRRDVAANARFMGTRADGDGEYGHTFATWSEVRAAIASPDAPAAETDLSYGWPAVFVTVTFLASQLRLPDDGGEHLRIAVWASS